ncbi:hypothetical protein [Blastococcus sp. VKM Ac-2987]|uniref:hypothetical protein n=1 Tax=Blastococcus sp. VKM Ac-2987 TaxID=3004141 RepID=UPI0022ABB154|nr:hypothetical protein [Blastococcus sp. VKM Ac-2987]MCZ2859336.1 hypothetical protein [Blastococcus sp. VKM Ac-2987]
MDPYVEPGGSWRPFWAVAGVLGLVLVCDLVLPGADLPPLLWVVALVGAPGAVALGCLAARRVWTVRVDADGLAVGREQVPLREVDAAALRDADRGVDAGAPVLGGGGSLPRGRTGLPLRLIDGRTVLVPTRDPAALRTALLAGVRDTSDRTRGTQGTLGT